MLDNKNGNGFKSNGNGNGHHSRLQVNGTGVILGEDILDDYDLKILDDEPKSPAGDVSPRRKENPATDAAFNDAPIIELEEGDAQATHDVKRREGERGGFFRRLLIAGLAILLVGVITISAVYLILFRGKSDSGLTFRRRTATQTASQNESPGRRVTAEEIGRERAQANSAAAANPDSQTPTPEANSTPSYPAQQEGVGVRQTYSQIGADPITSRPPLDSYSATVSQASSPQVAGRNVNGGTAETSGARVTNNTGVVSGASPASSTRETRGYGPSTERSIRANPPRSALEEQDGREASSNLDRGRPADANRRVTPQPASVPLPPLGTMLPVRTLGTIYTLRSEALVRMQLTRAASGEGWSLQRGTEFYGVLRGADREVGRAYVSLIGFVDPDTNRLVRLSGNLLGGDGTDGVRGRKRQLHSRWSRAARGAFAGALDVLGALASSVGRHPVVISDVYGQRTVSPFTQELNRSAAGRDGGGGFVEVPANTPGYVLVLTMPRSVQGVDAQPDGLGANLPVNISVSELQRLAAEANGGSSSQLSDAELSELLTTGNPAQIRAALPRMTPAMRRVAEQVLAQGN